MGCPAALSRLLGLQELSAATADEGTSLRPHFFFSFFFF